LLSQADKEAIREAVLNATSHKNYATLVPIQTLSICKEEKSKREIANLMGYRTIKSIKPEVESLLNKGKLKVSIPDKPKSKNQKYIAAKDKNIDKNKSFVWNVSKFTDKQVTRMMKREIFATDGEFTIYAMANEGRSDYVELQHPDSNTPEIGIDLLESKRNKGIALKAVRLFAKRVCEEKEVDYFLIRISSNNLHSQHVFEKMGVVKIGEEESAFSKFVERFGEIAGKEGQDLEKYRYLFGESDDEVVYCYRLDPDFL